MAWPDANSSATGYAYASSARCETIGRTNDERHLALLPVSHDLTQPGMNSHALLWNIPHDPPQAFNWTCSKQHRRTAPQYCDLPFTSAASLSHECAAFGCLGAAGTLRLSLDLF
jgi:hypothetical protein